MKKQKPTTLKHLREVIEYAIKNFGEDMEIRVFNGAGDRISYPIQTGFVTSDSDEVEFE